MILHDAGKRSLSDVKGFQDLEGKFFKRTSAFKLEYFCLAYKTGDVEGSHKTQWSTAVGTEVTLLCKFYPC